jgi:DNA-binding NarL/FixJ family response regulator
MLVLIVDDHPLLRCAVRQLIEHHYTSSIVREASNADEAMRIVRAQPVELLVLDIALPDQSGLTLLKQIKPIRPKIQMRDPDGPRRSSVSEAGVETWSIRILDQRVGA